MSEIMIALLLLVPIAIVVIILNTVHKSSKRRQQALVYRYITEAIRETGVVSHYHRQLVHQTVVIDEKSRRLLVIDHKMNYDIVHLNLIRNVEVVQKQITVQKGESITTHIGVEVKPADKFLCLYDHQVHDIYQMADLNKDAMALKETITKARNNLSLVT